MNIVLIGYRGTGKTSVGRILAARLGMPFVDTDDLIIARAGKNIRAIFEEGGEAEFRDLESVVVKEVAQRNGHVIASGGGVLLRQENRAALKATGKMVWLQASAEILHERISRDHLTSANRPNLTTAGGLEEIRTLLAARTPSYAAAADVVVSVENRDVEQIAAAIVLQIGTVI